MVNGNLPDGWEWKRLGDITRVLRGASPRPKGNPKYYGGTIPWIKISDITSEKGKFLTKTVDTVTEEGVKKSRFLSNGSLILSICATVCVPKILSLDGCIHDGFVYFPDLPDDINKTFLYYYFESIRSKVVQENRQGMTQVNLNTGIVSNFQIPILPFPEQERIVSRIEELFSDMEAGVAALERVRAGLKRYKASVLKAAVIGKLVNGKSGIGEDELPEGWQLVKAEEICDFITKGTTPKANKLFAGDGEVPFIKVYNLTFDGSLNFSINPTFVSNETHNGELARSKAFPNDVLMNIVGPPLGKVSIVPNTYPEWNMNQAIARFRPLEQCDSKYLAYVLMSDNTLQWATKRAKATAGQFNLTLEICRELPIPLPPLEEQRRIVAEVERRLSVVGEVESAVEVGLVRAARLRQAVLRSAFEGRL